MERTESWSLGLRPVQSQWPWVLWGRVSGPLRVQTTEVREMCLRPLRRGSSRGQRARGRCPLPTEGPVGRGQGGRSELQWRWLGFQGGLPSASQLIRSPSPLTPKGPMDCSQPGSSVHGIFQARILEWVAVSFSSA